MSSAIASKLKVDNHNIRSTSDSGEGAISQSEGNWLEIVERQVRALRFGSVQITVHEGRVVQVETSVKVRFDKA
jgi:hypothetical protein